MKFDQLKTRTDYFTFEVVNCATRTGVNKYKNCRY